MFHPNQVIGMEEDEAIKELEHHSYQCRVMSVNGESFFGTCDYLPTRVNLTIVDGVVTSIWMG